MPGFVCEHCGARAEVADTCLHFDAAQPEAYTKVVNLEPYTAECGRCGATVVVPRPTLYVDHERRFAVRVRPSGFRMPLYTGPLDYTLRETQLLLEFREKIILLTHGLDDLAVELLKVKTLKANPESAFDDILLVDVHEDYLQMSGMRCRHPSVTFNSPLELYESVREAVPDAWRPEGFATVDIPWVQERITGCAGQKRTALPPCKPGMRPPRR